MSFPCLLFLANLLTKFFAQSVKLVVCDSALFNLLAESGKQFVGGLPAESLLNQSSHIQRNVYAICLSAFSKGFFGVRG
jgi:hypothetical protein